MNKRKVCLFTAHSPKAGGGGTILQSLVANLTDVSISWYYTSGKKITDYEDGYLGKPLMGGNILRDIWQTRRMLANNKSLLIESLVNKLCEVDCDVYWIVSHNEGLRVATELAKAQSKPVHLTIHDDWAGALCARSIRYRFMSSLAKRLTISTLKSVSTFDVISEEMKTYYKGISGIEGEVCHRYLLPHSIPAYKKFDEAKKATTIVGHIGSIYSKTEFMYFVDAFLKFTLANKKQLIVKLWGSHLTLNNIPPHLQQSIKLYAALPEEKVVPQLAQCSFVYAMYPFNKRLSVFTKTSFPTKLTSYLQAGRPILGHAPEDSTLSSFLSGSKLGVLWNSKKKCADYEIFSEITELSNTFIDFNEARNQYFGERNLTVMYKALNQA